MVYYAGKDVLLKTGTWAGGTTVAGFRSNDIKINNQTIDASSKDSTWRTLIAGGQQSATISGSGVISDAASFETLRGYATAASINTLSVGGFGSALALEGSFIVTDFTATGEYQGEQTFSFTAESCGTITYTAT